MKINFITFGDSSISRSKKRITKQALEMDVYDYIYGYDEKGLDQNFCQKFKLILNNNTKGYGYWIWKSQIIKQQLNKIEYGDIIHYADSGCHLNKMGRKRLLEYLEIVKTSFSGVLVFQPRDHPADVLNAKKSYDWPVYKYTKVDLLDYFGVMNDVDLLKSQQIVATTLFLRKTKITEQLVEEWCHVSQKINLIDDTRSARPQIEGFIDHRHDQSIFSLIVLKYLPDIISNYEIEYPDLNRDSKLDFRRIMDKPIHAKRDKGRSLIEKIKLKMKNYLIYKVPC